MKMRGGVNKKGISPVIASVLMILLVLVLAVIIFLWARGFIGEQVEKFGGPIEDQCANVNIDIVRYGSELEISNRGNVNIRHLDIKLFKGGNSEVSKFDVQVDAGKSARAFVTLEMKDGTPPEKIIAYPALIGNVVGETTNSVFTCIDNGITI